jgi:hypothetical protein
MGQSSGKKIKFLPFRRGKAMSKIKTPDERGFLVKMSQLFA